jgi:hypothetical protein
MALLIRPFRAAAAIAFAAVLSGGLAAAQPPQPGERAIKAAFLYNFTKFIDWPESAFAEPEAPFTVCVFADAAFHEHVMAIMQGEQVRSRPVVVVRRAVPNGLATCHMAYFGRPEADAAARWMGQLRELPILTVGEGQRFMQMGGHIAFHLEHDRVRFSVNRTRAEAAHLQVSSKLLRVARTVE